MKVGFSMPRQGVAALVACLALGGGSALAHDTYIAGYGDGAVSVVSSIANKVFRTIRAGAGGQTLGVAVTRDGGIVYVSNENADAVSVIEAATNTLTATIPLGDGAVGVSLAPDGANRSIAEPNINSVAIMSTVAKTATATVPVGDAPLSFGVFIRPPPLLVAGVPGDRVRLRPDREAMDRDQRLLKRRVAGGRFPAASPSLRCSSSDACLACYA